MIATTPARAERQHTCHVWTLTQTGATRWEHGRDFCRKDTATEPRHSTTGTASRQLTSLHGDLVVMNDGDTRGLGGAIPRQPARLETLSVGWGAINATARCHTAATARKNCCRAVTVLPALLKAVFNLGLLPEIKSGPAARRIACHRRGCPTVHTACDRHWACCVRSGPATTS